jgi:hypothetical protein
MKRLRLLILCVIALIASSAVAVSCAQAEEPYYEIKHVRLGEGKTIGLELTNTVKAYVIKSGSITVKCKMVTLKAGATLIGSKVGGLAATNKEAIEYKECTQEGNGILCVVEGEKFTTVALTGTLARDSTRKFIDMYFKAESGTTYATVNFTGACNQAKITISGSTVCEYIIGGKHVEVGKEPEEVVHPEFNFPTTQISVVFFNEAEVSAGLKVGEAPASQEGRSETQVSTKEEWGEYT